MESAIDSEFQHEICESGLSNIDRQGANGELDDDGKPKRTGGEMNMACGLVQNMSLIEILIGYTITTSTNMVAIHKSHCFHKRGHEAPCKFSNNPYMTALGIFEILLSQIPNFHELSWLSSVAAIMSFGYASIGIGLSFARDTLKSSPPENKVMKKANTIAISTMTVFFLMCGCLGYAAFGNEARGNMLTGFGFYEPFWLIDLGNIMIVVHLLGSYQVIGQPVFRMLELWASMRWPNSKFLYVEYPLNIGKIRFSINFLRLIWRTIFVVIITVLAMAMPFFNEMLSLLGAIAFWPVAVYFPVEMYIAQKKIRKRTFQWFGLQILSLFCFLVSLAAACGAIQGLNKCLHASKAFQFKQ
ncbi:amino acid permease 6 [Quercus suber]|uniref:Amino acid permease 6 n=1 Tax=Quercus suber TaxID=58331 RepID=A0AAW0J7J4_QUESU